MDFKDTFELFTKNYEIETGVRLEDVNVAERGKYFKEICKAFDKWIPCREKLGETEVFPFEKKFWEFVRNLEYEKFSNIEKLRDGKQFFQYFIPEIKESFETWYKHSEVAKREAVKNQYMLFVKHCPMYNNGRFIGREYHRGMGGFAIGSKKELLKLFNSQLNNRQSYERLLRNQQIEYREIVKDSGGIYGL
jgi:hypothetical protein